MEQKDIRWEQRFANYRKALAKMTEAVGHSEVSELSELEKEGLIQRFEYTYELAWKTLQDLLKFKGHEGTAGPSAVLKQALLDGYIEDAEGWRELKRSREMTSHTYDSATAERIADKIHDSYYHLFKSLEQRLSQETQSSESDIFET